MTTVYLKNDNITVKVPSGTNMRQIATKSGASMDFGCRVGDCATCIAKVETGSEYLNKKTNKELTVLEMLGTEYEGCRLMCQCIVNAQEGEITISYNC